MYSNINQSLTGKREVQKNKNKNKKKKKKKKNSVIMLTEIKSKCKKGRTKQINSEIGIPK